MSEYESYHWIYSRKLPLLSGGIAFLDSLSHHFEKGRITPIQFYSLGKLWLDLNEMISIQEYYAAFTNKFEYVTSTLAVLKAVKEAGYKLILFSNVGTWDFQRHMQVMYKELQFDDRITSYRTGAMKDEDGMYLELMDLHGGKVVYVDDIRKYVEKGLSHGWKAFQFDLTKDRPQVLVNGLRERGVEFENPEFEDPSLNQLIEEIRAHQVNPLLDV